MLNRDIVVIAIVLVTMVNSCVTARPEPRCPRCPPDGCPVPTDCLHGVVVDNCGRSSCGKGPGERCRIKRFRMQGNCGEGMYCHCGVCMGCSMQTFECYEDTCVIAMHAG